MNSVENFSDSAVGEDFSLAPGAKTIDPIERFGNGIEEPGKRFRCFFGQFTPDSRQWQKDSENDKAKDNMYENLAIAPA